MTIANALTLLRLCLIPLIVVLIHERRFDLAFYTFTFAGLTDALDGYIARRFNQMSEIGAYLDALADKSLIGASFLALLAISQVPYWLVVLVLFRDLMIVGAVAIAWLMQRPISIDPLPISKWNTAAQISMVSFSIAVGAFEINWPLITQGLQVSVALLTLASVAAYFARWFQHMAQTGDP